MISFITELLSYRHVETRKLVITHFMAIQITFDFIVARFKIITLEKVLFAVMVGYFIYFMKLNKYCCIRCDVNNNKLYISAKFLYK
jgi:hypothetical protein